MRYPKVRREGEIREGSSIRKCWVRSDHCAPMPYSAAVAVFAVFIGLIFLHAPGWSEDEWAITEPGKPEQLAEPPDGGVADVGCKGESKWVEFRGGRDGRTRLMGKLCPPSYSNSTAHASPVVVMAHGLGLAQECSLESFANAFVNEGLATFTFDYATFGHSSGSPRHVVDPKTHIADIRAAIATLCDRSKELGVNAGQIGLWGTSLGGGHVLSAALDDAASSKSIKAVVSQVPHLASGLESVLGTFLRNPITYAPALGRVLAGVLKGLMLGITGSHWYLPLHGKPGSAAAMQNSGDSEGYGSLCPPHLHEKGHWKNSMTSGSVLRILFYRPLTKLTQFRSEHLDLPPTLLVAAENDTLCPAMYAKHVAKRIRNAELLLLDGAGHFDVYDGKELERVIQQGTAFFRKHLIDLAS